jgi:hypothetical protein
MSEMEKRFPGSREKSVFASVELSLRRISQTNQDRTRVLGMFHGGVQLGILRLMMQWEEADLASLAGELIDTGLATPNLYSHLTLNPALCPYLRGRMDVAEREALTVPWVEAMGAYSIFLRQQQSQNADIAATLTMLELPNLFALLDLVLHKGDAEVMINFATTLHELLRMTGKPRLLGRVGHVRDTATAALGDTWNNAQFLAASTRIEQQLATGQLREALTGARQLLHRAQVAGEQAYPNADYDLAGAFFDLARVLTTVGASDQSLPLLDEARQRFEGIAAVRSSREAESMAAKCFSEQGTCLWHLGRLDEAVAA